MELSVTLIIIVITVVVSLMANSNTELYSKLMFNPYQVVHRKEWWRVFGHALIHARDNIFHLIFNMYVLYSFGNLLENLLLVKMGAMSIPYYLLLYVGGVVVATIPSLIKHKDNYGYNSLGASGAVSAVLFAVIAFAPFSLIEIWFMPPLVFGVVYIAYEVYMDKRGGGNVAHDAHIWGAAFGFIFTLLFIPDTFKSFVNQVLAVFN